MFALSRKSDVSVLLIIFKGRMYGCNLLPSVMNITGSGITRSKIANVSSLRRHRLLFIAILIGTSTHTVMVTAWKSIFSVIAY